MRKEGDDGKRELERKRMGEEREDGEIESERMGKGRKRGGERTLLRENRKKTRTHARTHTHTRTHTRTHARTHTHTHTYTHKRLGRLWLILQNCTTIIVFMLRV